PDYCGFGRQRATRAAAAPSRVARAPSGGLPGAVDGARRAEAQATLGRLGQIELAVARVGAAVDHPHAHHAAAMHELELRPARHRLVRHTEHARRQRLAAGGAVAVEPGPVIGRRGRAEPGHAPGELLAAGRLAIALGLDADLLRARRRHAEGLRELAALLGPRRELLAAHLDDDLAADAARLDAALHAGLATAHDVGLRQLRVGLRLHADPLGPRLQVGAARIEQAALGAEPRRVGDLRDPAARRAGSHADAVSALGPRRGAAHLAERLGARWLEADVDRGVGRIGEL